MSETYCGACEAITDGFLCRLCVDKLEQAIGDMPALLTELDVVLTRQDKTYRANGGNRPAEDSADPEQHLPAMLRSKDGRVALRAFASPVNLNASELAWEARNTLAAWARHLAESRDTDAPDDAGLIGWLLRYVESFRWDEAGPEAFDELTYVRRQLERAVDRSPSRLYAGPCHSNYEDVVTTERDGTVWTQATTVRCDRDLYAWPGATEVKCDGHRADGEGCGAIHTAAERQSWLVDQLQYALVTVDDFVAAMPTLFPALTIPPRASFRGWVRDNRLMAHGKNTIGEPTYVGGEVLTLVQQYRPHRYSERLKRKKHAA